MALRFLRSDATKIRRTPQGGLELDAVLTKPGVFTYYTETGRPVREYRPPAEVFAEDALATLVHAPVTNLHHGLITADNWREHAVGHVVGKPWREGDTVVATLAIQDRQTIEDIEAGRVEVSCGALWGSIDSTPGEADGFGRYDCVQRSARYNHVAIVPRARLGSECRLRLDGAGNEISEDQPMRHVRFDGKDWPVNTEDEIKSLQAAMAAKESATQARLDAADERVRTAETRLSEAQARFDAANTPAEFQKRVAARTKLERTAVAVMGSEFRCDGLDDAAIMRKVAAKKYPALVREDGSDKKDATYVRALFEGIETEQNDAQAREDARAARAVDDPAANAREDAAEPETPAGKAYARAQNAWKSPLSASKK